MTTATQKSPRKTADIEATRRQIIHDLIAKIQHQPNNWKTNFIKAIAAWPIESERIQNENFHYFIAGEALNWKRLAERIASQIPDHNLYTISKNDIFKWIDNSSVFGGMNENQFRKNIRIDLWRAHLNYFYGVQIEQCIIADLQARIHKRQYSNGKPTSDNTSENAFFGLYEDSEKTLWKIFINENSQRLQNLMTTKQELESRNIPLEEEFTYWLFKRRIEHTNAPQIAAETKRGLDMMAKINKAHDKRTRMLKDDQNGTLLEFHLVKTKKTTKTTT